MLPGLSFSNADQSRSGDAASGNYGSTSVGGIAPVTLGGFKSDGTGTVVSGGKFIAIVLSIAAVSVAVYFAVRRRG